MSNSIKEKELQTDRKSDYTIDPIFLNRWSPRSFLEREIPEEVLYSILEAARWAPSAANLQPWRFILARNEEDKERFYSFINEGNLRWCKKAPVLLALVSEKSKEGNTNRAHAFDTGTAWGHLALQASMKGLISHAMGGFDPARAKEVLDIPENFEVQVIIAIGYQGDKDALPEQLQQREKTSDRLSLNELLYEGKYNS